jgi:DNA-binding response OmpR family regulator
MTPNPTTKPNPPKEPARDAPCPALTTKAVKKTILMVDDDEQIRESLHKVLCAEGYKVVLAAAGWEGIEKFNAERIDCLLLDVNLPDMSGWEVFGTITSINPFLPIIIITGKDEQHDLAVLGGVGALIEKPLDVLRLLEMVKDLLAESPEVHLQRLVSLHRSVRLVQPAHPDSHKEVSSAARNR